MMAKTSFFLVLTVLSFTSINCLIDLQDYCTVNKFETNTTYMQFTKEASFEEFAIVGKSKALHCCAKGYRSIEWYKDGLLYPWSLNLSQLIVYPESANQTVYTKSITVNDAGNYTCLLRNDSVVHSHTIHLTVFEKLPDMPKVTYISQNQDATIGEPLRLFCEAFGGQVDLPDAHNEAIWSKIEYNGSMVLREPHVQQKKTSRETQQTFGTYLLIDRIRPEDFGNYSCQITKPGKTIEYFVTINEKVMEEYLEVNPIPVVKLIITASLIMVVALSIIIIYLKFGLSLRVRLKDSFSAVEDNDGKICDILIVYSSNDSDLVFDVLAPTLENHYNYKCVLSELPANLNSWYSCLHESAEKYRRIIAILSPAALNNKWDSETLLTALKNLHALDVPQKQTVQCVTLEELPLNPNEIKNANGETLSSFSKWKNVLFWNRSQDAHFWNSLRLRLPPMRKYKVVENSTTQHTENSSRLTCDTEESLNSLV